MYEYYDAVLHAVREGLLLVDTDGRVQLLNDEAKRLLGLDDDAVGRPVDELGLPPSPWRARCSAPDRRPDEIHLIDDAVLVVNTAPARWQGREVGTVVTLRDHTELQAVAGRARHRPRARRVAALADPRGGQPAAHGGLPGRAGPHRRGAGLRHRGARGRPAAHRPGGRRRSPTRWSPRCCSARPRRPPSAGSQLRDRPTAPTSPALAGRPARRW